MNESLTYLRTLEQAGFTRQQAEAQMAVFSDTIRTTTATRNDLNELRSDMRLEFASVRAEMSGEFAAMRSEMKSEFALIRSEMAELRAELKSDMALLRAEMKSDMKSLEDRITIRLGGMMIVGIGALAALIKLT